MFMEPLGRAIQADRERAIREALRARALIEERIADPRPSAPEPLAPPRRPAVGRRYADPAPTP